MDCPQSAISLPIQYFLWRKGDALLFLLGDLFSFSISPIGGKPGEVMSRGISRKSAAAASPTDAAAVKFS